MELARSMEPESLASPTSTTLPDPPLLALLPNRLARNLLARNVLGRETPRCMPFPGGAGVMGGAVTRYQLTGPL